ncbi:MAG: mannonate dehydratase [Candidatus Latescibacterota bacterium]|nr:mannonate dehydratase [Candidatus Latescibacterota bacterium]
MTVQHHLSLDGLTDVNLDTLRAIGVDYIAIMHPPPPRGVDDQTEMWRGACSKVDAHGMKLYNVGLRPEPDIIHGRAGQERGIEGWCTMIRSLGAAGIPTLAYNFRGIGNFRTEATVGRGGARYSTFDYDEFTQNPQDHPDLQISEERLRENLHTFLERIVPVAEESEVLLTVHPDDPPIPEPLGGAARVLSTLEDFERVFQLVPSGANAMLFCQGCVAEMGHDVPAAIRRIGGQGKIGTVHFRNIRGGFKNFQEVFVDEGDMDMFVAMQTYREVGFEGPFMLDHTPGFPNDSTQWAGTAYAIGYIRAMIQAVLR